MIYLTFIRQAEIEFDGAISRNAAWQLFTTAQILAEKFGKPDALWVSDDDSGICSGKIVNLICGIHGIRAVRSLCVSVENADVPAFFENMFQHAAAKNLKHVLIVCHPNIYQKIRPNHIDFGQGCVLSAVSWDDIGQNGKILSETVLEDFKFRKDETSAPPDFDVILEQAQFA